MEGLKRKKHKIKGDRGEPAENPPILKLVFSLELKNFNFISGENLPNLIWLSPFIVSFEVVTCLVTSLTWMEVKRFRLNFYNCY